MNCPKCGSNIQIKVGTQIDLSGAKILTSFITILTVECEKCKNIFQAPVQNKMMFTVKKDPKEEK